MLRPVIRTFSNVGSFVILAKPLQVLVLNPWHPLLILITISFICPFSVALLALFLIGKIVIQVLLLLFRVFLSAAGSVFGHD